MDKQSSIGRYGIFIGLGEEEEDTIGSKNHVDVLIKDREEESSSWFPGIFKIDTFQKFESRCRESVEVQWSSILLGYIEPILVEHGYEVWVLPKSHLFITKAKVILRRETGTRKLFSESLGQKSMAWEDV